MSFCTYSSSLSQNYATLVDNEFINEFLPGAPGDAVKVYMYGLYLCSKPQSDDNDIQAMSSVLSMNVDEILEKYAYWQELGLVQIVNKTPFEIKYLSVKKFSANSKLRVKAKYQDFNKQVQDILNGRMITPMEYNEYYNLIELHHFEPDAIIMIIKYCTTLKNTAINYPYILAVAKSFESQGIKSAAALEQKLLEQEKASGDTKEVLKALGLSRDGDLEERNMLLKWTSSFGFTKNVVLQVAKSLNKKGGMTKLDETLTKYYEQKLFTLEDIENFSREKETMYNTARKVTSTLGLYYQNLESTVDVYIKDWFTKGYDSETIELIAYYAYTQDIRNLSLLNEVINKLYKMGLITKDAINQHLSEVVSVDKQIKEVLDHLGLLRKVTSSDRDTFRVWSEDWDMPREVILLVADKAKGTANPIRYMNKLLSSLRQKNIRDVEAASKELSTVLSDKKITSNFQERDYSKEDLNALFDSLDDIEV